MELILPLGAGMASFLRGKLRLIGIIACAAVALAILADLARSARPSTEAVRLRNALLILPAAVDSIDWVPPDYPAQFKTDHHAPDPRLTQIVRTVTEGVTGDWQRALRLAGHLTENARDGGPIQADTWTTYRLIRETGRGYCADFTQTYLALAHAAGIPAREWGFSFDGFGGHGHAVIEVFDRDSGRWAFVDVFNNFHIIDSRGTPMSVAEWRAAIVANRGEGRIVKNGPGRLGFIRETMLRDYYRRGIDGWYLWMGSNLGDYESHPLVRLGAAFSRSGEQAAALLVGVHPRIQLLATPFNQGAVQRMKALRTRLLVELPLLLVASTAGLLLVLLPRRRKHAGGEPVLLLVGPLPPPSGGMANQCRQLREFLVAEGLEVRFVQTNAPYSPAWVGSLRGVRAIFRLVPYVFRVWRELGQSEVVHLFANSGTAWYVFALPVLVLARLRRVPCIVNYRGGEAQAFFSAAPRWVVRSPGLATAIVVPSGYLAEIFAGFGHPTEIVPNIIDLARFAPKGKADGENAPHLIVTRNLEPIYDIPTALTAFARVRERFPGARLTVAGSGPDAAALRELAGRLGVSEAVNFCGRVDNRDIPALYAGADLMLNPSRVDNMPISILEALASGVPVVSTDAGGIPYVVSDRQSALLVPVGEPERMAAAAIEVLADRALRERLVANGLTAADEYSWERIRLRWLEAYRRSAGRQEGVPAHA